MAKRIVLFLLVNFLVVITISFILSILGIKPYLTRHGLDYASLAVFCLIWGMGGALISLALSRVMAKWMMGVELIDEKTADPQEQALLRMVSRLSDQAGLPKMPQVGIYQSPELNAFATGPTRSRALVAVSSGLLQKMSVEEIEGVLGHELSHVANGDMVTMTLLQGIINAFVMFLARAIAFAISQAMRSQNDRSSSLSGGVYYLVVFVLEIVFMILGSLVVAWFSRYREFRADAGGANLAGRGKMVKALQALQRNFSIKDPRPKEALEAFKISSHPKGFMKFFATHPPLEVRIEKLQSYANI